jgi:hypothetical protein
MYFYPPLENSSNETTECGDLPNKYYVRIFLTAVAELPGKSFNLHNSRNGKGKG